MDFNKLKTFPLPKTLPREAANSQTEKKMYINNISNNDCYLKYTKDSALNSKIDNSIYKWAKDLNISPKKILRWHIKRYSTTHIDPNSRFGTLTVSDAIEGVEHQELSHTAGRCNNVGDSRGVSYKANISLP